MNQNYEIGKDIGVLSKEVQNLRQEINQIYAELAKKEED